MGCGGRPGDDVLLEMTDMLRKHAKNSEAGGQKDGSGAGATLSQLRTGQSARVMSVNGGADIVGRLRAMGVLPGAVVTKKSAMPAGGPVVLEREGTQFAVGRDMADSIVVEPINGDEK
jgi:Fe2+ transport system protein FeoA